MIRRGGARFSTLAFVALVVSGLWVVPAAAQDDREAARTEFEAGRRSFEAGAFREALDHFQEAYRLAPHPNVRVNIANCYDQLERPIEALFHFEHYLTEADHPPPAQRREVETAIARLRGRVGTITLQITPDGAQITIDATETRRAPVAEPVRVVAGPHTVEVTLDGFRPERQTVVVEGGGTARLALRLQRAEAAVASAGTTGTGTTGAGAATATGTGATGAGTASTGTTGSGTTGSGTTGSETTGAGTAGVGTASTGTTGAGTGSETAGTGATGSESGSASGSGSGSGTGTESGSGAGSGTEVGSDGGGGLRITMPVIVAGAVTAAALVTAIIFGPLALSANSAFENAVLRSNDMMASEADRLQAVADGNGAASDARTFALVADVMLITAAVGAGVTTALFIIAQGESDEPDAAALRVLPVMGPSTGGVLLAGQF